MLSTVYQTSIFLYVQTPNRYQFMADCWYIILRDLTHTMLLEILHSNKYWMNALKLVEIDIQSYVHK